MHFYFFYWFKIKNNFWAEDSYENDRKVKFIYSNALQIQMTYKSTEFQRSNKNSKLHCATVMRKVKHDMTLTLWSSIVIRMYVSYVSKRKCHTSKFAGVALTCDIFITKNYTVKWDSLKGIYSVSYTHLTLPTILLV